LKAFVAYRSPNTKDTWFLNTLCQDIKVASFVISPFQESEDFHPFYFSGQPVSYQQERLVLTIDTDFVTPHSCLNNEYEQAFNNYIAAFENKQASKAILSRIIAQPFDDNKLPQLFDALIKQRPDAFVYWFYHPKYGHWLGATPEILLHQSNEQYKTVALAGTTFNNTSWTQKEKTEQQMVTDYVADCLRKQKITDYQTIGPEIIEAGPVKHLKTTFKWSQPCEALELVEKLHPTPAICGLPKDAALALILANEKHQRAFYSGYLGPITQGKPQLYVNLRCMQQLDNMAYLYVGGGITIDSNLENEWKETSHKAQTLLGIMENL
jgi:isochorismate synthase